MAIYFGLHLQATTAPYDNNVNWETLRAACRTCKYPKRCLLFQ